MITATKTAIAAMIEAISITNRNPGVSRININLIPATPEPAQEIEKPELNVPGQGRHKWVFDAQMWIVAGGFYTGIGTRNLTSRL